jgi:hypothetical protein
MRLIARAPARLAAGSAENYRQVRRRATSQELRGYGVQAAGYGLRAGSAKRRMTPSPSARWRRRTFSGRFGRTVHPHATICIESEHLLTKPRTLSAKAMSP